MEIKIDEIIKSKRKTILLSIEHDARLVIRAPYKTSLGYIEKIVRDKSEWIRKKQETAQINMLKNTEKQYINGEEFLYLGESYPLKYSQENYVGIFENSLIIPIKQFNKAELLISKWYRKEALKVITERVQYYSKVTGISYSGIKVTNASRRWGSCNSKNSLCFTWRLVMAPVEVIDYVVVHELCHVIHKNHSSSFWAEVKSIMPNCELHKRWLTKNQFILDMFK